VEEYLVQRVTGMDNIIAFGDPNIENDNDSDSVSINIDAEYANMLDSESYSETSYYKIH
jgi:hypothetical protein